MLATIAQTFRNMFEHLKQLSTTNTYLHSTSSYHKGHHNNTVRHKNKYHKSDTKQEDNYNRNKSYSRNTHNRTHHSRHSHRTRINEIEDFIEFSS